MIKKLSELAAMVAFGIAGVSMLVASMVFALAVAALPVLVAIWLLQQVLP